MATGLPPAADVVRVLGAAKIAERCAIIPTPEGDDRAWRLGPVHAVIGETRQVDAVQDPLEMGFADRWFAGAERLGVNVGGAAPACQRRMRLAAQEPALKGEAAVAETVLVGRLPNRGRLPSRRLDGVGERRADFASGLSTMHRPGGGSQTTALT